MTLFVTIQKISLITLFHWNYKDFKFQIFILKFLPFQINDLILSTTFKIPSNFIIIKDVPSNSLLHSFIPKS